MRSRELAVWPNGIRLAYRQQFPCGHFVSVWSNREKVLDFSVATPMGSPVLPEVKLSVLEAGCIKCEPPKEPVLWRHRGIGGFLKNYKERI